MDPIREQREPEVLPGLTSEALQQTISTALVFGLVAGIVGPAIQEFVEPVAARFWETLFGRPRR